MKLGRDTPALVKPSLRGAYISLLDSIREARGLTEAAGKTGHMGNKSIIELFKKGKIDFGGQSLYQSEAGGRKKFLSFEKHLFI